MITRREAVLGSMTIVATGDVVTVEGRYKIHTFTGSGNFVIAGVPAGKTVYYDGNSIKWQDGTAPNLGGGK